MKDLSSYHVDLLLRLIEHPYDMIWYLTSLERVMERAQDRSHSVFRDLSLKTISHHFHNVLVALEVESMQGGMGKCKDMNTNSQDSLGAILEANYPSGRRLGKPWEKMRAASTTVPQILLILIHMYTCTQRWTWNFPLKAPLFLSCPEFLFQVTNGFGEHTGQIKGGVSTEGTVVIRTND